MTMSLMNCIPLQRRMMMTAGQQEKYSSSWSCARELVSREGGRALFRGAGVNIVRGVAGAGVLAGSDRLKQLYLDRRTQLKNIGM